MTIVEKERETYAQMWAVAAYATHSPGEVFVPVFLEMTQTTMCGSVLDAGCGAGKGTAALMHAEFTVTCCDLLDVRTGAATARPFVQAALWDDLKRQVGFVDWVYCCDVLEHIPTPFTMLAVSRLLEVARRGVFLSISLMPDQFGVWVGTPLHQTVQSFVQWRDQLACLGTVKEARDLLTTGVYLVEPRC